MGCDIHFHVEVRREGLWLLAYPEPLEYVDDYDNWEERYSDYPGELSAECLSPQEVRLGYDERSKHALYVGRNYSLFSRLAGVRQYSGGNLPIKDPIGFPEDASPAVQFWYNLAADTDWHTPSWYTLRELLDVDWGESRRIQGYVDLSDFAYHLNNRRVGLTVHATYASERYEAISFEEAKKICDKASEVGFYFNEHKLPSGKVPVVYLDYEAASSAEFPDFVNRTIPELGKLGDPEDVRIVFWFDN